MTGQIVSHYRILQKLGEGGMGVVYKAEDTKLRRTVALKFPRKEDDGELRERFLREAQAAAALHHPNICTVFEIDDAHGFLAMEFVEGRTLKERIAERPLELAEALDLAVQIGTGLQAAHEKGVTHRDIKPANVIITPQSVAKIMDFGLARIGDRSRMTKVGATIGTPAYMSPEQAGSDSADRRTDLWSLGVVLHEMITGRLPFAGDTDDAVMYSILHAEPEPLTALRSGLPIELDRIVAKLLAKNPAERYQHAEDLVVDLRRLSKHSSENAFAGVRETLTRRMITRIAGATAVGGIAAWLVWRSALNRAPDPKPGAMFRRGDRQSAIPEANEYYLMAMAFATTDFVRTLQLLEKALAVDPKFATARAEHALFTFLTFLDGHSDDPAMLYSAEEQLQRASRDDPENGRVHAVLGAIYLTLRRKDDAARELDAAHALHPEHLDTLNWRFNYHWINGDSDVAFRIARKMIELEPLFLPARMHLAHLEIERGNPAAAMREADKVLAQHPQHLYGLLPKARLYIESGDLAAAHRTLDTVPQEYRGSFRVLLIKALLLAVEGKRQLALQTMNARLTNFAAKRIFFTVHLAEFYAALADTATALDWLEQAVRGGDERAEWFQRDPLLASVRSTERFRKIQDTIYFRRQRRKPTGKQ